MIHRTELGRLLGPLVGLVLILIEGRLGPDHVPSAQGHHGLDVTSLGGDVIKMHAETGITRTIEFAMLVRFTQSVGGRGVTQFGGGGIELSGVRLIGKDRLPVAGLVQEGQLVRGGVVLSVDGLGTTLQPFDGLTGVLPLTEVTVDVGQPQPSGGAGMTLGGRLTVELNGLDGILSTTPAELVTDAGAITGLGVTVLTGGQEQGKGAVVVGLTLVEDARGETVGQVVLGKGGAIGQSLEDLTGFPQQIGPTTQGQVDVIGGDDGGGGGGGGGGRMIRSVPDRFGPLVVPGEATILSGVDEEDGEAVEDIAIVGLLGVGAIHLQRLLMTEQGRVGSDGGPEMRVVQGGGRGRGRLWIGYVEQIHVRGRPDLRGRSDLGRVTGRMGGSGPGSEHGGSVDAHGRVGSTPAGISAVDGGGGDDGRQRQRMGTAAEGGQG